MQYNAIKEGRFLARPNRFIAIAWVEGQLVRAHVKNTGRCAELLVPGARIWLEYSAKPVRSTPCDLVAVEKRLPAGDTRAGTVPAPALPPLELTDAAGQRYAVPAMPAGSALLINMDSNAPNAAAAAWLAAGGIGQLTDLRAEHTVGDSRFDFTALQAGRPVAVEVKGCTLEREGLALFPDAPTQRGVKHIRGLQRLAGQGWRAVLLVVVQMKGAHSFAPNSATDPAFAAALCAAAAAGVEVIAMDCTVTLDGMVINAPVRVELTPMKRAE